MKFMVSGLSGLLLVLLVASSAPAQVSPESAEKYVEGQGLFKKRRYQEALGLFEEAIKLDGKNAQAYRAMGLTYKKLRNYPKAMESLQMAVTIKPDYASAYYDLGQIQYQALEKYEDAQSSFKQVLEIDPAFEDGRAREYLKAACVKQGRAHYKQRNYRKAAREYEDACQLDPSDALSFYNLGLAYRKARNYKEAVESLTTAIDLNPHYGKALRALGDLYRDTKKNSLAIKTYRKAIESEPENATAYRSLSIVYVRSKQPDKAIQILRRAAKVAPKDSKVQSALGYAQMQKKDFKSAIKSYQLSLSLNGNNPQAHYRLADAYLEAKQYQRAMLSARKALRSKFSVPANVILGDAYAGLRPEGWKGKAISHYEKGLKDRRYQKYCEDKIDRIVNPMGGAEEEAE